MIKKSIMFLVMMLVIGNLNCTAEKNKSNIREIDKKNAAADVRVIDQTYNNAKIDLSTGQNIIVRLDANPSTGYRWQIVENNDDLLPLIDSSFKQRESAPGMVGVGGTEDFTFKAAGKGQVKLHLRYARALPNPEDTAKDFEVRIDIK